MMKRGLSITLLLIGLTALGGSAVVHLAYARDTHVKFAHVVLPDGTDGIIRAGVYKRNGDTVAIADYFTPTQLYLGQYREVDGFHSTDDAKVLQWAFRHFGDRTAPGADTPGPDGTGPYPFDFYN